MGVITLNIAWFESMKFLIFVLYFIVTIPGMVSSIAHGGWLLDKYPDENVGKFQGIRMIFMVLIPMVIGPFIGAWAIDNWGITIMLIEDIPTPPIFIIGGILSILAIIPILFIKRSEGQILFDSELKI